MNEHSLTRLLRLVIAAAIAISGAVALAPFSTQAAFSVDPTPFEIDSNTTGAVDWVSKAADGEVGVSNDFNFTGSAVVQSDVGGAGSVPAWVANCPKSNSDTVFKNSTNIADPDWTGDFASQSVPDKTNICQSYFAYDVVDSGARAGHVVAYIAFTRRVYNGDGSFYFLLSKGPNPDVRVDGDIVIEVDYNSQGVASSVRTALWEDNGGLALSSPTVVADTDAGTPGVQNANVDLSPVQYFAELAIDLTALDLAPNIDEITTPDDCLAFGYGRVIARTGNSASATLKDDGEPAEFDFNVCGELILEKQLTEAVPGDTDFPVEVNAPNGYSVPDAAPTLTVLGGQTASEQIVYSDIPPAAGYNVWEDLVAAGLDHQWDLDSITCDSDDWANPVDIDSDSDTFDIGSFESVTCTIVNSPAPVTINVDKNAGATGTETWPVDLTGDATDQVTVTDDGTIDFTSGGSFETFGQVDAGSYTLTEGAETGGGAFTPNGWSCTVVGGATTTASGASIGINANPGDVINCTITNDPVPPPSVTLVKSASPTTFPETATTTPITYTVQVNNTGTEPFEINSFDDLVTLNPGAVESSTFDLGAALATNGAGITGSTIESNTCGALIGQSVAPASNLSCTFTVSYVGRNAADIIDDTVTVEVEDTFGRTETAEDDATVTVTDVAPVMTVLKDNVQVGGVVDLVAPGGSATYDVVITNGPNAIEPITITTVTDTMSSATNGGFGPGVIDITTTNAVVTATTCGSLVGTTLAIGAQATCQITVDTTQIAPLAQGDTVTNTIDVTAVDDDGTEVRDDDPATRNVLGAPPQMTVFKSDGGATIDEPGENITYTFDIINQSTTENIFITSITDTISFLPAGGTAPADLQSRGNIVISDPGGGVVVDDSGLTGGVVLVSTDCNSKIGFELGQPGDPVLSNSTSCTMTLFLPGNAGDEYQDTLYVTAVDETGDPVDADNEAQTPVVNVAPAIDIVKDVTPGSVPETGGQVVFTLTITNNSVSTDPLTLTELTDSVFGDLFGTPTGIDSTNCGALSGTTLAPGASTNCTITATIAGNATTTHDNIASVTGVDDEGTEATDSDPAQVTFTDVLPVIAVTKTANPTSVPESGGNVTFTVVVENDSAEAVTTTTLTDNVYGNLVGLAGSTCVVGVSLAPSDGVADTGPDTYTCTFQQLVAQQTNELSHTNIVTATAEDDEQNEATDNDDATVDFTLVPPTVEVTKTDFDATVAELGGDVLYSIDVTNTSAEAVTITTLTDTIFYSDPVQQIGPIDLLAGDTPPVSGFSCSDDLELDPGETITCTFTVSLMGTAQIVTDTVIVNVVDNDGQTDDDSADEATPITDVRPTVDIVKTAGDAGGQTPDGQVHNIDVGDTVTYEFVITNTSIEDLTLLTLDDDKFGDIFVECALTGVVLTPGADTTCQIDRVLNETPGTTHTNVATVTGADDETLADMQDPDYVPDSPDYLQPVTDSDDADVLTLEPVTSVTKTIDGAATLDPNTGVWTIVYDIVITNSGAGKATIDVDDELKFGGGVTIQSVDVTNDGGYTTNPAFDGQADTSILSGAELAGAVLAPTVVTFTVTVEATIPTPQTGEGACDPNGVDDGGFLNTVVLTTNGQDGPPAFDCDPFSTLTLVKNVTNNDGGGAQADAFTLTATAGGETYVEGDGTATAAVPAGSYDLAESTSLVGYTAAPQGFLCSTQETGYGVTVPAASDVTCDITNDDDPVDVGIVKTHSGIPGGTAAPGESYNYVLTVTNYSTRTATDIVVTDQIPNRLTVTGVTVPAGWSNGSSANNISVSVPSMAPGATAQVVVSVQVKATSLPAPTLIGDGDPAPQITTPPLESLTNEACVDADFDSNPANDCDDDVVNVDDIVAVVYVRCVNDAPLMGYSVQTSSGLAGEPITLTWTPNAGDADTSPSQLVFDLDSGDGDEVAWPGVGFSPSGISIDYPGWRPIEEGDYVDGEIPASAIIFNGLILDNDEPDYAWRGATTLTFSVNPEISFTASYPTVTPDCAAERTTDLLIEKLASQSTVLAGTAFQYTIGVTNVSDIGAADNVVLSDPIPTNLRVDSIDTSSTSFPRWTDCAVAGASSDGYGGTLRCEMFGPLLMGESAPLVTLGVTANPATPGGSLTNTAVVEWTLADDPEQTGTANDSATVAITAVEVLPPVPSAPVLPPTGSNLPEVAARLALLVMGAGALLLLGSRRRRNVLTT